MPVLDITVSLAEVLEVQGTPLKEPEIWAILCQSTELLQDLFIRGTFYIMTPIIVNHYM